MKWNLIGHEAAVQLLAKRVELGQSGHAYLITGPPGIGRRTLAIRLAQAINCLQPEPDGSPCFKCRICRQIERQQHADLFVIQAEKEGGTLKVDQIRELQHMLSLHPYEARRKVALLLRFEEAHLSAMNAILKTLEEPSPRAVIILTADDPENLLPTIVSRCVVIRLRPLSYKQLEAKLQERFGLSLEKATLLAHVSGGKPGRAVKMVSDPSILEERNVYLDELTSLMAASYRERIMRAETVSKDIVKLRAMFLVWLSFWRDVLLRSSGSAVEITNIDRSEKVDRQAAALDLTHVVRLVAETERAVVLLERNVNSRLILETLMFGLPKSS